LKHAGWILLLGLVLLVREPALAGRAETLQGVRALLDSAESDFAQGRYDEAAETFREVVHQAAALGSTNLALARAVDRLGDIERLRGRHEQALALYVRSSRMWEELLGEKQPRLATTLHNLAIVHLAQGRPDRALPPLRRSLAIWEATLGPSSPQALNTRRALKKCGDRL
jgi:tetratricopeptide (TPR) repeat protein